MMVPKAATKAAIIVTMKTNFPHQGSFFHAQAIMLRMKKPRTNPITRPINPAVSPNLETTQQITKPTTKPIITLTIHFHGRLAIVVPSIRVKPKQDSAITTKAIRIT